MYLALDVHYKTNYAKSVGVTFLTKDDEVPQDIIIETLKDIEPYQPGEFYKRELPCLLQVIAKVDLNSIDAIIVDGHVYIDNAGNYGLGGYLYQALDDKIPIIGVAKRTFHANKDTVIEVLRGTSNNPLHVSSIGIDLNTAAQFIKEMHGDHRHPTLLKTLDTFTKTE
ncbi:endonuclease V [Psychroserpens luteus]|uniref:Endonuclease V n=1 Tax=Psychroserpens luteus TaxID=1434066 RepID=A0ABW5ZVN0_9FLAO|nr:endonuclease V [Psychroserpens luteus]